MESKRINSSESSLTAEQREKQRQKVMESAALMALPFSDLGPSAPKTPMVASRSPRNIKRTIAILIAVLAAIGVLVGISIRQDHFVRVENGSLDKKIQSFYLKNGQKVYFSKSKLSSGEGETYPCKSTNGFFWVEVTAEDGTKKDLQKKFDFGKGNAFTWTIFN